MLVPGSANPLLLKSAAAAGGYQISRSLRFNASDSAYCGRAPGSASNQKTWTFAAWVKRTQSKSGFIFAAGNTNDPWNATATTYFGFGILSASLDTFDFYSNSTYLRVSSQVFRDYSAWGHLVVACDTTQATAANRLKIYWNGVEITTFATNNNLAQNTDTYVNGAHSHFIGGQATNVAGSYLAAYLADIHFCDGTAYDPSSFTETDATTGQLIPKAFSGTYGTNGFHLDFADNSAATASTLGKDTSGLGNNWTPNNLSVTAGAGNDSLVDVPTNGAQTDTGVGGEVRGNYCTLNPLKNPGGSTSFANGNLESTFALSGVFPVPMGTIGVSSGKWYWEVTPTSGASGAGGVGVGIGNSQCGPTSAGAFGVTANGWGYYFNGNKYNNNSSQAYGTSYTNNDVIGVALDCDAGTLVFYKNGTSQGTAYTGLTSGPYFPGIGNAGDTTTCVCNFGQRPFAYTAPSGFKALCTTNLPAPLVTKPSTVMDVKLYTGNASTNTITGLGFNPDFIWIKSRSNANWHNLFDAVRGNNRILYTNATDAEANETTASLTSFNSDGFTLSGNGSTGVGNVNGNGTTYVGWCWDAGTSTVTNTQGSITSSVRANATAGFSVVTYTGTGSAATVGHGLGVAPSLLIVKQRNAVRGWSVYHKDIGASYYLQLERTDAKGGPYSGLWNDTAPTSTVFSILNDGGTNASGGTYVGYCFAPVVGYSNGFSYTGNGSSDGPMVYLGFRPRLILLKRSDSDVSGNASWWMYDTARSTYNIVANVLGANLSSAETTPSVLDILSNGFKLRETGTTVNASGGTFIGFAWAESPFNYSRAR